MKMIKKSIALLMALILVFAFTGCKKDDGKSTTGDNKTPVTDNKKDDEEKQIVVGFAQSRMNHPYRVAAVEEFQQAVKDKGLNWKVVVCDGQNDNAKQTSDVEDLITQKVDVIVMSPITADPLAPVSKKVLEAGIPLVLLDRTISTDDYTTFVGGDNILIGQLVAEAIAKKLDGAEGKVVEIQGTLGSSATTDRHQGFLDTIAKYPNIELISDTSADYDRAKALALMEDILQTTNDIAAVYCHNDAMAIGAMTALNSSNITGVDIYGADGTKEVFDEIKNGNITGSAFYPTGSTKAVEVIEEILAGKQVEKKYLVDVPLVDINNMDEYYDQGL